MGENIQRKYDLIACYRSLLVNTKAIGKKKKNIYLIKSYFHKLLSKGLTHLYKEHLFCSSEKEDKMVLRVSWKAYAIFSVGLNCEIFL